MQLLLALAIILLPLTGAYNANNPPPLVVVPPQYPTVLKPNDTGEPDIMCYRCNMYRGGGTFCPESQVPPQGFYEPGNFSYTIMNHCAVCMKITTVVRYRDRSYGPDQLKQYSSGATVVSRACALAVREARLENGCISQHTHSGYIQRCYCTTDLCNSTPSTMVAARDATSMAFVLLLCLIQQRWQLL